MKLLFLATFIFSTSAFAQLEYKPIAICGNNALVIDQARESVVVSRAGTIENRVYYQLVLKDQEIVRDFISKGAIYSNQINSKGEFILGIGAETYSNTQFYGMSTGHTTTVKLLNDGIIELKTFSNITGDTPELANFIFKDCRLFNH